MNVARRLGAAIRRRPGTAAIVSLGIAWFLVVHSMGWAQLAHFAQVRAFADGQAEIDRWHWETGDKAWVDGHFYSVKSPGVAALTLPAYLALDAVGAREVARDASIDARADPHPDWAPRVEPPYESYGFDRERALAVDLRVEGETPLVWALTLIAAVIPALFLLALVRDAAGRLEPGFGAAAAITLGLATMVMVFAAEYFSHVIAATLGFAAFVLLMRERAEAARIGIVALAGLLAGLAVTFEYQVGLVGLVLFFYAVARGPWLRRGAAYAAGAVAGALPALAFNAWALGSPFQFAYGDAVATQGASGHAELGLNDDGFFGIAVPSLESVGELLIGGRGLLVLTPVLAAAVIGVVLMHRRGHRAEAWVIAAVAIAYFAYNSGYWLPLGGGTPGPRFLVPALPFLALGLAFAYRRLPALTLALAIPSAIWMVSASLTYPLIGEQGTGLWADRLADGTLEHTLFTLLGVHNSWLANAPVLLAMAAAIAFAVVATPRVPIGDIRPAVAALGLWIAISVLGPVVAGDEATPLDGSTATLALVAAGALTSLTVLAVLRYREARAEPAPSAAAVTGELALGERTS